MRYVGADPAGHTTDRRLNPQAGGANVHWLEASGVGTLEWAGLYQGAAGSPRHLGIRGTGDGVFSGRINTGGSTLTKDGTGTWTLAGTLVNSFSTATVVAGSLIVAKQQALGDSVFGTIVQSGATLGFSNIAYAIAEPVTISGTGDLLNNRAGAIDNVAGISSFGGTVTLAADATIGVSTGSLALLGLIDDGVGSFTLTKNGPGNLTLSRAAGNTYDGGTVIEQGKLTVLNLSGSATGSGDVLVNANATLAGNGIIGGSIDVFGGLEPGLSPGTLTIEGNATLHGGGSYTWEINDFLGISGANFDLLDVQGTLAFTSTSSDPFVIHIETLDMANTPGPALNGVPEGSWVLATASGGITGFNSWNVLLNLSNVMNS